MCAPLHPNSFIHPVYNWSQAVDVRVDPEALFKLSYNELKKEFIETFWNKNNQDVSFESSAMEINPLGA